MNNRNCLIACVTTTLVVTLICLTIAHVSNKAQKHRIAMAEKGYVYRLVPVESVTTKFSREWSLLEPGEALLP